MNEDDLAVFPPASETNPSFFTRVAQEKSNEALKSRLEEILGPLTPEAFETIKEPATVDFNNAVNQYLDTISAGNVIGLTPETPSSCLNQSESPQSRNTPRHSDEDRPLEPVDPLEHELTGSVEPVEPAEPAQLLESLKRPDEFSSKLLGSFQAEVWCTRSGSNLVQFEETLEIIRKSKSLATRKKEDYVVRLVNKSGIEFARASENDAKFMAILMDTKVCTFSATCIYAEPKLSLGSSIIIQIDCYLLKSAFGRDFLEYNSGTVITSTIKDETKEQGDERVMRLRQLGIAQMFGKLGLSDVPKSLDMNQAIYDLSTATTTKEDANDEDLPKDQLDMLYRTVADSQNQLQDKELKEAEPADTFALKLYPYQKRGLSWMLGRENSHSTSDGDEGPLHPLWKEFLFADNETKFWANLHSGELSLERPGMVTKAKGGILADEMGLGKTISTLSLIHSTQGCTLVVAPMSLLSQWDSEVQQASKPDTCLSLVYYGTGVNDLLAFMKTNSGKRKVIITSYGVLVSEHKQLVEFRKKQGRTFTHFVYKDNNAALLGLYGIDFERVVLDEAHTIKNRTTRSAKACYDIQAKKRWALTGTPIVNRLEDLYSLVRFLEIEPWNNFAFWQAFVTRPFENKESQSTAMATVQSIISPLCLRRTKSMREKDGTQLVALPEKVVEIRRVDFSPEERDLYRFVYNQARQSVEGKLDDGTATKSYTAILALVLRLRQVCDHATLLRSHVKSSEVAGTQMNGKRSHEEMEISDGGDKPPPDLDLTSEELTDLLNKCAPTTSSSEDLGESEVPEYTAEVLRSIQCEDDDAECSICSCSYQNRALTECLHSACLDCLLCHIDYQVQKNQPPLCHICRKSISSDRIMIVSQDKTSIKRYRPPSGARSAKVRALLQALRTNKGNGKNVVFSQFTSFLDILEKELTEAEFKTVRFDGTMSQQQRAEALAQFRDTDSDIILLLSLKAGGVGLNLVCAQQAFLMDPWWSYAVEAQAIDRIHRMGQTETVHVVRFIVSGTIEERMLKIQERKRALSSVVTDEERRAEQLENIRLLFSIQEP